VIHALRCGLSGILDLVYPRHCAGCGKSLHDEDGDCLCGSCRESIRFIGQERCPRCATPVGPYAMTEGDCLACRKMHLRFRSAIAVAQYEGAARELIHQFKYRRSEVVADTLAGMMLPRLADEPALKKVTLIVPVPLSFVRYMERGFNQSELLARRVGQHLGVKVSAWNLKRVRNTASQAHLPANDRLTNVADAFAVRRRSEVAGQIVLLVDDVMTTGATASECAKALKAAGAKDVHVLVMAR